MNQIVGKSEECMSVVVKRRMAEIIEIRAKGEYVVFTIDNQAERHHYGLCIESSFGGFSYAWSDPGCNFNEFLAKLNLGYVLGKMVGDDSVFDGEATTRSIRLGIIERRRARDCTAEEARVNHVHKVVDLFEGSNG